MKPAFYVFFTPRRMKVGSQFIDARGRVWRIDRIQETLQGDARRFRVHASLEEPPAAPEPATPRSRFVDRLAALVKGGYIHAR